MAKLPNPSKKLNNDELKELFERCAQGDPEAREQIIVSYIPLVNKLCSEQVCETVPLDDLFQEGCYGLMLALDKYDPSLEINFATYARHYILKYIRLAKITQSNHPIIYNRQFFYKLMNYFRVIDELTEKLDRRPSDTEISRELNITVDKVKHLSESLYTFFPFEDLIENTNGKGPINRVYQSAEDEVLNNMQIFDTSGIRTKLTKREEEVIRRRCGFTESGEPESIKQIAADLGLHIETIRLAYIKGIEKLRKAIEEYGVQDNHIIQ